MAIPDIPHDFVVVILNNAVPSSAGVTASLNRAFDSTPVASPGATGQAGQASGERPPANEPIDPNNKKLHIPLGWWSFCESGLKQMWAIAISFSG
jgi:hypothetical protein